MKRLGFAFVLAAVGVGGGGLVACGGDDFDSCESNNTCGGGTGGTDGGTGATGGGGAGGTSGTGGTGGGGTGGTSGTGGSGGDGGGCDTTKSPSEEACLVADAHGVFVSPTGDDSANDGTKDKPFKTIGKALTTAGTAGKNVYVCDNGTGITESATMAVSAAHDKHGIYGGFDCTAWAWSATAKAKVSGAAVALTISNVGTSYKVENLDVTAANAAAAGDSSFGAIVASSKGVVFTAVNLTAGEGKAGDAGGNGTAGADGADATAAQNGAAASCATSAPGTQDGGKWAAASACGTKGGNGGIANKAAAGEKGSAGIPQTNVNPANVDNGGAFGSGTGNGNPGQPGSNGNAGTLGTPAQAKGAFTSAGFTPADGNPGGDGFPGQGGGGGGASASSAATLLCIGASGGAGGMAGCGGGKGTAGKGGGASVALLSWQSELTLTGSSLTSKKGGDGGKGGSAAAGGSGKSGGQGGPASGGLGKGGTGGDGGNGGPGGSGSGGTGGPSYALVWSVTKPTMTTTLLQEGAKSAKGVGGAVQVSGLNPAPDGSPGDAGKEFEQK